MPKIWNLWLQKISGTGQGSDYRGALPQEMSWGHQESPLQEYAKPQPSWLTPAYLRQQRSGDRINR